MYNTVWGKSAGPTAVDRAGVDVIVLMPGRYRPPTNSLRGTYIVCNLRTENVLGQVGSCSTVHSRVPLRGLLGRTPPNLRPEATGLVLQWRPEARASMNSRYRGVQ